MVAATIFPLASASSTLMLEAPVAATSHLPEWLSHHQQMGQSRNDSHVVNVDGGRGCRERHTAVNAGVVEEIELDVLNRPVRAVL